MKSLPSSLLDTFKSGYFRYAHLLEINISPALYYTTLDIPITFGGNTYTPRGFEVENIIQSSKPSVDSITLNIDNIDGALTPYLEDMRGKTLSIKLVALDGNGEVIGGTAVIVFNGVVNSIEQTPSEVSITADDIFLFWKKKTPKRIHQATCPWTFKDANTCKYSGAETWCDQSFERCQALGNTANFGGFRFLPALKDKKIWWGRVPK